MIGPARSVRPQQGLRLSVLLVFAVITGVLGMHALGSTGPQMPEHRMATTAMHGAATAPSDNCHSLDHGCDGGAHHADATCASGAVAGTAALAAPDLAEQLLPRLPQIAVPLLYGTADGGRAPPTLAELQLLRI
ncbi:hypothetical protein C8250_034710 [Streptomyces sp. So13.3]|uniref:DUF6153 family protein n=1 Tax=Streptomyces TaxID=1883 RepID=UPI00110731C0|nr:MULTISPECIES: DUF6153 family protein [unclassified Streptomyces]MCZ4101582.1 DUF6153 family protein [Streptomyces sp. H39-C1]QNA76336.1 hypothetical protein C8250_034710 [Streptomyces sp. So13.3]